MNFRPKTCFVLAGVLLLPLLASAQQSASPDQRPSVSDQLIQQVLEPLRTGMETQNIKQVLSLFDQKELDSYAQLQAQLTAFFQQFDEVNFRYRLLQAASQDERATAIADVQMDALPYEPTTVPTRRSVQMRLRFKDDGKVWKIAGFSPDDFFSVSYSAK